MQQSNTDSIIGYILIEQYKTDKPELCETPRHKGKNFPAYAVMALQERMRSYAITQMICYDCWKHFDDDMGHPNWKLEI